jgi:hypothetical protein
MTYIWSHYLLASFCWLRNGGQKEITPSPKVTLLVSSSTDNLASKSKHLAIVADYYLLLSEAICVLIHTHALSSGKVKPGFYPDLIWYRVSALSYHTILPLILYSKLVFKIWLIPFFASTLRQPWKFQCEEDPGQHWNHRSSMEKTVSTSSPPS